MIEGLVLGKFMPFHAGHIALIDFALSNTNSLHVLVCANRHEPIAGQIRYHWLTNYYQHNKAVQVHLVEYDEEVLPASSVSSKQAAEKWANYLKEHFPGIHLFISSEPYGEWVAEHLGINQLCFDTERNLVPISATAIREYPFKNWAYVPAIVRPYFVKKICIAGSESTGKSLLTERLAHYYKTVFVPETARDIIDTTAACTAADLYTIATAHARAIMEKKAFADKLLFVDTDITITSSYAAFLFDMKLSTPDWVNEANQFDLYLFLETDCPYVQDGTRMDELNREKLNTSHKNEFARKGITYHVIHGDWEQRFNTAVEIINNFF